MADVFISYSRRNTVAARAAAKALRESGFDVWLDHELAAHGSFADAIERELTEASAVLTLWSADAAASEWVRAESNRGREARKLVQVRLDTTALPLPFDQIQCTSLPDWRGDTATPGWAKVVDSISALVAGKPTRPGAPVAPVERRPPSAPNERLLAVLAFDNLSPDREMDFFSDGVADEIQQTLARSPGVKVLARSSTFQFRGAQKAVRHVTEELQATHLLDGSVRRAGRRVRINAQLVDCASGHSLWADSFQGELDDIFALQDEIAEAVTKALAVVFSPPMVEVGLSIPTYEIFLKAQTIISEGARQFDNSGAIAAPWLEKVVAEAPGHARAWELLANCRAWTLRSGKPTGAYAEGRAGVLEAAENALRLDPARGGGFEALATLEPWAAYGAREALLERALRAQPNEPSILSAISTFFWGVGRVREALKFAERACALNPLFPAARLAVAQMHVYVGNQDDSIRMLAELHHRWPENYSILLSLLSFSSSLGYWDAYAKAASDVENFEGWEAKRLSDIVEHAAILSSDDPEPRLRAIENSHARLAANGVLSLSWLVALCHYGLGDEALSMAERADFSHMFAPDGPLPAQEYPGNIFGPWCSLNKSPRFIDLCDRIGLCRYWLESDRWPDCAEWVPYDLKAEVRRRAGS